MLVLVLVVAQMLTLYSSDSEWLLEKDEGVRSQMLEGITSQSMLELAQWCSSSCDHHRAAHLYYAHSQGMKGLSLAQRGASLQAAVNAIETQAEEKNNEIINLECMCRANLLYMSLLAFVNMTEL